MIVKCPVCQSEYDCAPGKYQCDCGAKFYVAADGSTSVAKPATQNGQSAKTVRADVDRTIPPRTTHDDTANVRDAAFDPERTVVNMRIRRERGELQVGDVVLGRYELLEKLGSGAMGVVFKCRDQVSQVEYALKMVPPELAGDAEAMEEVRENFQLVHGLKHPNIASVDFLDRDEYGAYFLIMEFAKGESLAQWIKRKWKSGRPELKEVADIVRQIASALDYAHGERILHRDIKPANVMVDENGKVKVLDFGLASKVRNTMTALSINPANTSGTPNYLSPEQFKGKYPTPASDQYALGVLTYQMLAGRLPFDSDDPNILRTIVTVETPDSIDGIPEAVNQCLAMILAKDPKARFAHCTAFANALTNVVKQCPPPSDITQCVNYILELSGDVNLTLVKVEAGSFMMGSSNVDWEEPHKAILMHNFYIGKTEVTQAQWKAVMGNNNNLSHFKGDNLPVEQVSWYDAMKFCAKLNELGKAPQGWNFTLPTETQWEFAARGGNKSCGYKYSGGDIIDEVGWYYENSGDRRLSEMELRKDFTKFEEILTDNHCKTHPVAMKHANELGLYDMSGNVFEWCLDDWYYDSDEVIPEFTRGDDSSGSSRIRGRFWESLTDLCAGKCSDKRVIRGGFYGSIASNCSPWCRFTGFVPDTRENYLGFRLALVPIRYK